MFGIRIHSNEMTSLNESGNDISAENRNIHFINVITEYLAINGLNIPRYKEKLRLLRNISRMPDVLLSDVSEPPLALLNIRNNIPQRLSATPAAFFQLKGSFNAMAAINIV